jgi:hypothetical protein
MRVVWHCHTLSFFSDRTPLPAWISFDSSSRTFAGTAPPSEYAQSFRIKLIASEVSGFGDSSLSFTMVVSNHTWLFTPFSQSINVVKGAEIRITGLKQKLFVDDSQAGDSDIQSATANVPSWLSFDNSAFDAPVSKSYRHCQRSIRKCRAVYHPPCRSVRALCEPDWNAKPYAWSTLRIQDTASRFRKRRRECNRQPCTTGAIPPLRPRNDYHFRHSPSRLSCSRHSVFHHNHFRYRKRVANFPHCGGEGHDTWS